MSTRVHFPSTGAAPVLTITPPTDWDVQPATLPRLPLVTSKGGSSNALLTLLEASAGPPNKDMLFGQWVSDELTAQTIDGTMTAVFSASEDSASLNAWLRIIVRVIKPDGTVRGVLFDSIDGGPPVSSPGVRNQEVIATSGSGMSYNTRIFPSQTLTSVAVTAGDRLEVTVGLRTYNTTVNARLGRLMVGDESLTNDFPLTSSLTAAGTCWLEFSDTITFGAVLTPPSGTTVESGARVYDYTGWTPGEGGALSVACVQLTSDPSVVITQSPSKVITVTFDRPVLVPIQLKMTVSEVGGTPAEEFHTIGVDATVQHLYRVAGAWV